MIYFTTNFTSSKNEDPIKNLQKSLLIWLGFIMFAKQTLTTSLIIFGLLIFMYINDQYIKYFNDIKEQTKDDKETLKYRKKLQNYLIYGFVIILVSGFAWYSIKKRKQYNGDFNLMNFLFGTIKCNYSIKN